MGYEKEAEDLRIVMDEISKRIEVSLVWQGHINKLDPKDFRESELKSKVTVPLTGLIKKCADKSLRITPKYRDFITQVDALEESVQSEALEIFEEVRVTGKDVSELKQSYYDIVTKRFSDQFNGALIVRVPGRWLPDMFN